MAFPPDLTRKIQFILRQSDPRAMYRHRNGTAPIDGSAVRMPLHGKGRIVEVPGEFDLVNEQALLLKQLYSASTPEHQAMFVGVLTSLLDLPKAAPIIGHLIIELKSSSSLRYWERFDEASADLWTAITDKLAMEHWLFSDEDLENIMAGAHRLRIIAGAAFQKGARSLSQESRDGRRMLYVVEELQEIYNRVEYVRLRGELRAEANPAVDLDRRVLLSRLEALGLDPSLTKALHEVERRGTSASTEIDFKSAMDFLRTFFEEFVKAAARKIEAKVGKPVPTSGAPGVSHFGSFKDYLRNADIIGPEEERLLQQLYNYLSNEGSHKLGTAPEQFRVAKVTVIEWCMMVAGRVQAFLS